jgi:hypothetical protein
MPPDQVGRNHYAEYIPGVETTMANAADRMSRPDKIEKRGGYPSGSKPVADIKPPPVSITKPKTVKK